MSSLSCGIIFPFTNENVRPLPIHPHSLSPSLPVLLLSLPGSTASKPLFFIFPASWFLAWYHRINILLCPVPSSKSHTAFSSWVHDQQHGRREKHVRTGPLLLLCYMGHFTSLYHLPATSMKQKDKWLSRHAPTMASSVFSGSLSQLTHHTVSRSAGVARFNTKA